MPKHEYENLVKNKIAVKDVYHDKIWAESKAG